MTTWTTPTHVTAGEADSAKFNEETVDNLLHLHNLLNAVAIRTGERSDQVTSGTTGDDGVSVSFGTTFASAPNIQLTIENNSNADILVSLETRSTTGFTYRAAHRDAATNFGSTHNYVLHWTAIGPLA